MRLPRRRLVGLLLTLTAASLLGLFLLGLRSLNKFEAAYAGILRESADSTADQLAQQISRDFKAPVVNLLEQIDHPSVTHHEFERVAAALSTNVRAFPTVASVFVWSATPGPEAEDAGADANPVLFFHPPDVASEGLPADVSLGSPTRWSSLGFFTDPQLSTFLEQEARRNAPQRRNYALSYLTQGGRTYHIVLHFIFEQGERNPMMGFMGFLADTDHLRDRYFSKMLANWRSTVHRAGFPPLTWSIFDEDGKEMVRNGRSLTQSYDAETSFPFLFFDTDSFQTLGPLRPPIRYWTVRTGYEEGPIASLAHAETVEQRWAWVLVGIVAVGAILLAARATAHDLRLSQMRSEFVASVSHELKTPLAKIQLFAETLESGRVRSPEKAASYYRIIAVYSKKLSVLIGQLLDFSNMEAGVRQYPLEELDLSAVVRSAIEMFDYELARDQFTVEIEMPEVEVIVRGNGEGLLQLFGNLIGNAVKYSPNERFLRIRVSTTREMGVVEITDRGIGIPYKEHRHIFKKFYRGENTRATTLMGSGIGLAIAEDVVKAHGGTISVSSAPGEGSTFKVELPLMSELEGQNEEGSRHRGRRRAAAGAER